jgi:hypothetical protein
MYRHRIDWQLLKDWFFTPRSWDAFMMESHQNVMGTYMTEGKDITVVGGMILTVVFWFYQSLVITGCAIMGHRLRNYVYPESGPDFDMYHCDRCGWGN